MTHQSTTQKSLFDDMIEMGVTRYRREVNISVTTGNATRARANGRLLSGAVPTLADAMRADLKATRKGPTGRIKSRLPQYALMCKLVGSCEVIAGITCKVVIDRIYGGPRLTTLAAILGHQLEHEARFKALKKDQPYFFKVAVRNVLNQRYTNKVQRLIGVATRSGAQNEAEWVPWTTEQCAHLGLWAIEMMRVSTGLIEVIQADDPTKPFGASNRKWKKPFRVFMAKDTEDWVKAFNMDAELLTPVFLPMVEPPAPWVPPFTYGGGYGPVNDGFNFPLIKTQNRRYLEAIETKYSDHMGEVYDALNTLQSTPWVINRPVLGALKHLWTRQVTVGGLPPLGDVPLPPRPPQFQDDTEKRRWKKAAHLAHIENRLRASKRFATARSILIAEKFVNEPDIFFPYQMDFRGRVYPVPFFLQPQGADVARGLLKFGEGKAITTKAQADWLRVCGANHFGMDKIPVTERVQWVIENEPLIKEVAEFPTECLWWGEADAPFQFLAFCFEYAEFLKQGYGFVSSLPIHLDGTNNGLQILSLLMRDPVGAIATNVVPGPTPMDIYGTVAEKLKVRLGVIRDTLETPLEERQMADSWLSLGITRKTCKRPVMVLPYGGTIHSTRDYIAEWYKEVVTENPRMVRPWALDRLHKPSRWLATIMWESIKDTVGCAQEAMEFLQGCAEVAVKANRPVSWVTPSGFPVLQQYFKGTRTEIKGTVMGRICKVYFRRDNPKQLAGKRMLNGVSPNFVHSLDAACLHKTVGFAKSGGIKHFSMIHDSYGTVAADVDSMAGALRHAFSTVFATDLLGDFRDQVASQLPEEFRKALPEVPKFGSLDVTVVRESEYFFL